MCDNYGSAGQGYIGTNEGAEKGGTNSHFDDVVAIGAAAAHNASNIEHYTNDGPTGVAEGDEKAGSDELKDSGHNKYEGDGNADDGLRGGTDRIDEWSKKDEGDDGAGNGDEKGSTRSEDHGHRDGNDHSGSIDSNQDKEQPSTENETIGACTMDDTSSDTQWTLHPILIEDSSQDSRPTDITVPPLTKPIEGGERFLDPGTVPPISKHRVKRCKTSRTTSDAIAGLRKGTHVKDPIKKLYHEHVLCTLKGKPTDTKVSILGTYVTEEEFRSPLQPSGRVGSNFMLMCCMAMMADWESKSKIILDPVAVTQLILPIEECDVPRVRHIFSKFNIDKFDTIYLPIVKDEHWFLFVINLKAKTIQIYDSLLKKKDSEKSHKPLWQNVSDNLVIAIDNKRDSPFGFGVLFRDTYPESPSQMNLHDYGFCVLRMIECHNGKSLIGYSTDDMFQYRIQLCHRLIHHRFNDLHPCRVI